MRRFSGIAGCVFSSLLLFTVGYVVFYGSFDDITNFALVGIMFGLGNGVILFLTDFLTKQNLWRTVLLSAVFGGIIVCECVLSQESPSSHNNAVVAAIAAIGALVAALNGAGYWLGAKLVSSRRCCDTGRCV